MVETVASDAPSAAQIRAPPSNEATASQTGTKREQEWETYGIFRFAELNVFRRQAPEDVYHLID
jgi:hypothetical protein